MIDRFDQVGCERRSCWPPRSGSARNGRCRHGPWGPDRCDGTGAGATVAVDAMRPWPLRQMSRRTRASRAPGQACAETPGEPGPARTRAA